MRISGLLLQKGVAADLTIYDIACCMCRSNIDKPSQLEVLCAQAATLAKKIKGNVKRKDLNTTTTSQRSEALSPLVSSRPASPTENMTETALHPSQQPHEIRLTPFGTVSHQHKAYSESEERKLDDEDDARPSLHRMTISTASPSAPTSALTSALRQQQQQQQHPSITIQPPATLRRSNSLELVLRRSISYEDFRPVKVKKQGFGIASINMNNSIDHVDEEDEEEDDDEDENRHIHRMMKDDEQSNKPPTASRLPSNSSLNHPPNAAHSMKHRSPNQHQMNGEVYKVGDVYHHNGLTHAENNKADRWTDEQYSQLFFSCLNGLMDSHIERLVQQKKNQKNGSGSINEQNKTMAAPSTSAPNGHCSVKGLHSSLMSTSSAMRGV